MNGEEITIKRTIIQGEENKSLLFEVPVASIPCSLKSGKEIAHAIKSLFEKTKRTRLEEKRERFLKRADKAEAKENYSRAARAFALALLCEGRLRDEVKDACGYVRHAMPVY